MEKICDLVAGCGGRQVFVVTDPGVSRAGVTERVRRPLSERFESVVFEGVEPNPGTDGVEAGALALRTFGIEGTVVVAVGGGSAMDAAQASPCSPRTRAPRAGSPNRPVNYPRACPSWRSRQRRQRRPKPTASVS